MVVQCPQLLEIPSVASGLIQEEAEADGVLFSPQKQPHTNTFLASSRAIVNISTWGSPFSV